MTLTRLSATRDQYYATANMYDAPGNRAWTLRLRSVQALSGEANWMWNNGQGHQAYGELNLHSLPKAIFMEWFSSEPQQSNWPLFSYWAKQ